MLDQLRIQCPSCGIILDVRNSKHEALKQVVCPNCKKQLVVNFIEELEPVAPPQPIEPLYYGEMRIDMQEGVNKIPLPNCDDAEIKMVRLKDGKCKCMVRPLSDTIPVKVNRQQLQLDEQVVLSTGEYLEIGKTCLRVGEPGLITLFSQEKSNTQDPNQSHIPRPQRERNYIWLYASFAFVALMVATILLWPKDQKVKPSHNNTQVTDTVGSIAPTAVDVKDKGKDQKSVGNATSVSKGVGKSSAGNIGEGTITNSSSNYKKMTEYDLERLSTKGDTEAQYELGVKLIKRGGVSNVVRGINYLKVSANNGSSKARSALMKAINSLQKQANQGDSISYYILQSI